MAPDKTASASPLSSAYAQTLSIWYCKYCVSPRSGTESHAVAARLRLTSATQAAAMQKSATKYVLEKKMHYAAQLLTENEKSVTEIAALLSYEDIHSFSKAFKKFFGASPTLLRTDPAQTDILV